MSSSKDKTLFISGATGYLGSRITKRFAEKGYNLICTGTSRNSLAALEESVKSINSSAQIRTFACDVSEENDRESLLGNLHHLDIDHFVNCAAVQGKASVGGQDFDIADFRRIVSINLEFAIIFTYYFVNRWNNKDHHSIIHFSGGGATSPRPHFNSYNLTKTALVRFVENVSQLPNFQNISINAISPGLLPSRMNDEILADERLTETNEFENALKSQKKEESGEEQTIRLCEFLVSHASQGISGKLISSKWDDWEEWPLHLETLKNMDVYTLRRIVGKDRGLDWGKTS